MREKIIQRTVAIIGIFILGVVLAFLTFAILNLRTYTVIKEQEIYVEVKDSGLQVKKFEYSLYYEEKDTIYIIYSDDKIVIRNNKCLIDISSYKIIKTIENVTEKGKKVNE